MLILLAKNFDINNFAINFVGVKRYNELHDAPIK